MKHTVSRNNILHVRSPQDYSASENKQNADNDFDYDLFNGRMPQGQEAHGVRGVPVYAADAGFDPATKTGRFQLAPDSPGAGAAQPVPNFSDGYTGQAPDIGAHQRGAPPIRYGVTAWTRAVGLNVAGVAGARSSRPFSVSTSSSSPANVTDPAFKPGSFQRTLPV